MRGIEGGGEKREGRHRDEGRQCQVSMEVSGDFDVELSLFHTTHDYNTEGTLLSSSPPQNPENQAPARLAAGVEHGDLGRRLVVEGIAGDGDHGKAAVVELLELHGALVLI